jgi:hypothetical protein
MPLKLSQAERIEMLARWFDRIVDRYPVETASFLRGQPDPFANPVGAGLRVELAPILDAILDGRDPAHVDAAIDRIVRVRALQEMSPSRAVGFVLELKEICAEIAVAAPDDARALFDSRVDGMLLAAFDIYNRCREQVYDIRVKEIRNRSLKVMERLNSWREQRAGGPPSDA